ncbi:hypothetical protein E2C01_096948 [Portunus trituberculatus]|uniref:Uncharacterized protein n=1 Tax=Portunus trituberculatus TaxID=210409 RepID=A0A5B7JWZ6_PORTR|nr:hypothetical protein [Portunus trituberculatus]
MQIVGRKSARLINTWQSGGKCCIAFAFISKPATFMEESVFMKKLQPAAKIYSTRAARKVLKGIRVAVSRLGSGFSPEMEVITRSPLRDKAGGALT